jgi:hypothetical protein
LAARAQMVAMGAPTLNLSQQDSALAQPLALPEVNILFDPSTQSKNHILSKAMRQLARQDTFTQWAQLHSPILQHVQKVIQPDASLRARLSHLSQCEIKVPHSRFDLHPDKVTAIPSDCGFRQYALHGQLRILFRTTWTVIPTSTRIEISTAKH